MPTRRKKGPQDGDYQEPEPHDESGGAVKVHEAYLEHRLGGGAPATPEAYRRAIEQFQRLPGAVRSVPVPADEPEANKTPDDDGTGENR